MYMMLLEPSKTQIGVDQPLLLAIDFHTKLESLLVR
jgi:hypothetical protein